VNGHEAEPDMNTESVENVCGWMHKGNRPALTLAWLVPSPLLPFAEPSLP